MSRIAYVNGRYVPHGQASVHIEDRGYQFSDAIYEVCETRDGKLIDLPGHLDRLERSAQELHLALPMNRTALTFVMGEVTRLNRVENGLVYLQISRGVAPRNHHFPKPDTPPAIVVTARSSSRALSESKAARGISVISVPDIRWERVDIKTVSLLPNVLAKEKAKAAGADEAWFLDENGDVTEGASTNAWIVTTDNVLVTREATGSILKGITRMGVMRTAEAVQLRVEERRFTLDEAKAAKEAFISSASTIVMPVVKIDGDVIGDGTPGPVAKRLRALFHDHAL